MKKEIVFVVLSAGEPEAYLFVDALRKLPKMRVEHCHDYSAFLDYAQAEDREIVTFICSDDKQFDHILGLRV